MRKVLCLCVLLALSGSVFASPREDRDGPNPIVRLAKLVLKTLGDGLGGPTPAPRP